MMKRDLPLGLFAWCFVIFVAAFMSWGIAGFVPLPFFGATLTQTATGWTGNISLFDVLIPNWIVVVIAVAIAVVAWLRANSVDMKPKLSFWLALYGAFHAAMFIFGIVSRGPAQVGIGSIATLVAFVAIVEEIQSGIASQRMKL